MADELRAYRISVSAVLWTLVGMVVLGVVLLGRLYSRTDLVGAGLMWTGVGYVAFCALLITWGVRSATVVADAGVKVRGMVRSRFYPWTDIVDIEENQVGEVVLYDLDLRRVELPYLHRKRLGAAFGHELGFLIAQWESRRGPDWQSRTAALAQQLAQQAANRARLAEGAQARGNTVATAALTAMISFLGVMALVISTASSDFADSPLFELLLWPGILVVPAVAFLLVVAIGRARRRARIRR